MELKSYDILFDVNFEKSSFSGKEEIELDGGTDSIELNAQDLAISSVRVQPGTCSWNYDAGEKKLTVNGEGFSKIHIDFSGKAVDGGLHGFYKSKYKTGYFLSTQFEPVGARSMFPCIDNPSWKAVFRISVVVSSKLTVISNSPVASTVEMGDNKKVVFEPTPRMSTYLLFVGIGMFEEQRIPGGFDVIVASSPEQNGKGLFGIENGRLFLKEYEDYYSLPYPLKKLHLLAIPEFAVGAMENWGAITFREVALLVDDATSVSNKRLIASVLAHEIAHQWFGNLVTMKWWNDLWLNESFATYMSSVIVDRIYPKWEVWSDFLTMETRGAMVADSLSSTHPIEVEVKRPEEINQIFDEISYGKGASVLRMIATYIGEKSFRDGVNSYLKSHSYANAESSDLWNSLEKSSSEPVAMIMKKWVSTTGYPVVRAALHEGRIEISQERFLLNGADRTARWPIPIHYSINGRAGRMLFVREKAALEFSRLEQINLNAGQTGFYRVLYDEKLYNIVAGTLQSMKSDEKWGVISDLFYFVLSGNAELTKYLDFVHLIQEDSSYILVNGVASQLETLRELVPGNVRVSETFLKFFRSQLKRIGKEGKEGEDESNAVIRERLTEGLARYDAEFAHEQSALFESMHEQPPEIRGSIGISYARTGGESAFEPLLHRMKESGSDAEAMKALLGMTSFGEPELVRKTLGLAFKGDLNIGHIATMVYMTAVNPEGKSELWDWFKENREQLFKTYAGTGVNSAMVETIIGRAGIVNRKEVENYFGNISIPEADRGIAKGLEMLGIYSKFIEKYG